MISSRTSILRTSYRVMDISPPEHRGEGIQSMDFSSWFGDVFGFIFPFLERAPLIRAILGFILIFFLPGFAWTLVFFKGRQINVVERVVLSLGLSIAVVTLSILFMNVVAGIKINATNSVVIIIAIVIIPVVVYFLNKLLRRRLSKAGRQN